ncbi:hypothetical protein [Agrobacterium tumefaciens]|uniref:hypothetical protein n=1 Tax=Agrobacterium tumefaciens TaxID=358 RepID=UPI001F3FFC90|nr:hypothetical protein [Agrobacterium tumefaciens]
MWGATTAVSTYSLKVEIDRLRCMIRRFRDDVLPMMGKELQPVVGALYPLSATSDADRRMKAGGVFGKIVLDDFHG